MNTSESVQRTANLPSAGEQDGDICYVKDTRHYWRWDGIWRDLGTARDLVASDQEAEEIFQELLLRFYTGSLRMKVLGEEGVREEDFE